MTRGDGPQAWTSWGAVALVQVSNEVTWAEVLGAEVEMVKRLKTE